MAGENMAIIGRELARVNGGNIPIRLRRPLKSDVLADGLKPQLIFYYTVHSINSIDSY